MATDVKLDEGADENWVVIESTVLKCTASDLILDAPTRRKNQRPFRRALVHDQQDGLTINFGNDYPGGVTINDAVRINSRFGLALQGVAEISGVSTTLQRSSLTGGGKKMALLLRGDVLIEGAPAPAQRASARAGAAARRTRAQPVRLQSLLESLHAEIARLNARVDQLERRPAAATPRQSSKRR